MKAFERNRPIRRLGTLMLGIALCSVSAGAATKHAVRHKPATKPGRPRPATAPKPTPVPASSTPLPPSATPIGNPGDWFPIESYPPEARVAGKEGRTVFALDIDAKGRILACQIVQSSGSDLLDSTTCSQLIANGRFTPARDANGQPIAGQWRSAMRWQLQASGLDE